MKIEVHKRLNKSPSKNRSEGRDPNGICHPCVMGWGLAGTGNSSAAAVVVDHPRWMLVGESFSSGLGPKYESYQCDSAGILIVRMLRIFFALLEIKQQFGEGVAWTGRGGPDRRVKNGQRKKVLRMKFYTWK